MRALAGLMIAAAAIVACSDRTPAPAPVPSAPRATMSAVATATPMIIVMSPEPSPAACRAPSVTPPALAPIFCAAVTGMARGTVVNIVDGDTLDALVDGHAERVRIFGIDTPERGDRCFGEASDRLSELAGDTVFLLPDVRNRDRNGRLLRYLYTPEGLSIDATMIADGLARAWTRDGAQRDALVALEAYAVDSGVGCLW